MNGPRTTAIASGPVLSGAMAVTVLVAALLSFVSLGHLSTAMLHHIALTNIAAPIGAVALAGLARRFVQRGAGAALSIATLAQLVALWGVHLPVSEAASIARSSPIHLPHVALFITSLAFWIAVLWEQDHAWPSILALLVTGKLACMLGALLVFAPRMLLATDIGVPVALGDQQLAGLIMITACPLSYLVAGVAIAARAIIRPGVGIRDADQL